MFPEARGYFCAQESKNKGCGRVVKAKDNKTTQIRANLTGDGPDAVRALQISEPRISFRSPSRKQWLERCLLHTTKGSAVSWSQKGRFFIS